MNWVLVYRPDETIGEYMNVDACFKKVPPTNHHKKYVKAVVWFLVNFILSSGKRW